MLSQVRKNMTDFFSTNSSLNITSSNINVMLLDLERVEKDKFPHSH